MKQTGTVVACGDGLKAEVQRSEACSQCRACAFGQKERVLVDLPEGIFHVGDDVELTLKDGQVSKASLIAYGIPLALFAAGLITANALGLPEALQAAVSIAATVAGFACVRFIDVRIRKNNAYRPEASHCARRDGAQGGK